MTLESWFAVYTHAKAEEKAAMHLINQGYGVYLPRFRKRRSHARRVDTVLAPFFPRYFFVRLDLEAARWRAINSSQGVVSLVSVAGKPLPVGDHIVAYLQTREDKDGLISMEGPPDFAMGSEVRVLVGPMADLVGMFEMGDADRVTVLLSLLGRPVRVTLARENVAAA